MLQYACLENTLPDREAWQATVYRVAEKPGRPQSIGSQRVRHCYTTESQFLGRLIRSLGSSRSEGSGALEEEIGVWNSRGGNDKLFFFSKPRADEYTTNNSA